MLEYITKELEVLAREQWLHPGRQALAQALENLALRVSIIDQAIRAQMKAKDHETPKT